LRPVEVETGKALRHTATSPIALIFLLIAIVAALVGGGIAAGAAVAAAAAVAILTRPRNLRNWIPDQ
jgi:hypothetical protein